MNKRYLDLMEKTLTAYSDEHINEYFGRVRSQGLTEHGFPRLTANIGILIAYGRRNDLLPIFLEMMDFCCEQIPKTRAANNFSVKEILLAIDAISKSCKVSAERIEKWRANMQSIVPEDVYEFVAKLPTDNVHNWACFAAVSEQVRSFYGLGNRDDFIDLQISTQVLLLDSNGMYRDPNEPMVYDLVTRGLFTQLLKYGYKGKYRAEIDDAVRRAGLLTLEMQSSTGELAFGGRSNAFLHNEAHLAIIFEYEAARYIKEGNLPLARKFKAAASRALANIELWLSEEPIRHIKNRFPLDSCYGCEGYAYFDKYMITLASFLYVASLSCDDSIDYSDDDGVHFALFETSEHFHKVFMRDGDYFLEFDTNADYHYDSNGLGRVNKKDAPSAICISLPCTEEPNYTIDGKSANISISVGIPDGDGYIFSAEKSVGNKFLAFPDENKAWAKFEYDYPDGNKAYAEYKICGDFVEIKCTSQKRVALMLPALTFDGQNRTKLALDGKNLSVEYMGWICEYISTEDILETEKIGRNRNGYYKAYYTEGEDELTVKINIRRKD